MSVRYLELADFRIFRAAHVEPELDGTTVITGPNGTGKTTVLEAMAYLGTRRSFRGAPLESLVRIGATSAIVRAEFENEGRPSLVQAEIAPSGRSRMHLNRKPIRARQELAAAAPCTVFSPDDLGVVSGGPQRRRDLLDDGLALLDAEGARAADETERALRQRAALLRQAGGRLDADAATTLDVWDHRLGEAGNVLVGARERLVADLEPLVRSAFGRLAGAGERPVLCQRYTRSWDGDLLEALGAARDADVRRGVNTVGPHRDDLVLTLEGRDARTQASQGEQRCLALALRLGVHELVRARTQRVPTLLLDDVFSELDPVRGRALATVLPPGQSIVTTAAPLPEGITVDKVLGIEGVSLR